MRVKTLDSGFCLHFFILCAGAVIKQNSSLLEFSTIWLTTEVALCGGLLSHTLVRGACLVRSCGHEVAFGRGS